jgi:hypothetical protein
MDNDFLDGIDERFQRLMKAQGNGKGNGRPAGRSKEDPLIAEITDQLHKLSQRQKQEVLTFIQSLEKEQKVE